MHEAISSSVQKPSLSEAFDALKENFSKAHLLSAAKKPHVQRSYPCDPNYEYCGGYSYVEDRYTKGSLHVMVWIALAEWALP